MESKRITDMDAQTFEELMDAFIERETKDMGELDASLFYAAMEEIYADEPEPTTVEVKAQIVGSELSLRLSTSMVSNIDVHDNVININNLRFIINLVEVDELTI